MVRLKELIADFKCLLEEWDGRTLIVVSTVCVALLLNHYVPSQWLNRIVEERATLDQFNSDILHSAGFCLLNFFTLFLLPFAVMSVLVRTGKRAGGPFPKNLRESGVGWRDQSRYLWVFGAALVAIVPLVVWAALQEPYQMAYPFFFYARYGPGWLALWWFLYGLYYLGVEYFFRGFLIFGLVPGMGGLSILVSVIPYVMVHFSKPPSEALGSLVAGILLGYMALRSGSIWGGFLMHWTVGMAMDALSILFSGGFIAR